MFFIATECHLKMLEESFKVRYHFVVFGSAYASNDPVTLGPLKWRRTTFLRVSCRRNASFDRMKQLFLFAASPVLYDVQTTKN